MFQKKKKKKYRIFVVDDVFFVRQNIYRSIYDRPSHLLADYLFEFVEEAGLKDEFLDKLPQTPADIYFLDVDLPDGSGWDLIPLIYQQQPKALVIVMTDGLTVSTQQKREENQHSVAFILDKPLQPGHIYTAMQAVVRQMNATMSASQSDIHQVECLTIDRPIEETIKTKEQKHEIPILSSESQEGFTSSSEPHREPVFPALTSLILHPVEAEVKEIPALHDTAKDKREKGSKSDATFYLSPFNQNDKMMDEDFNLSLTEEDEDFNLSFTEEDEDFNLSFTEEDEDFNLSFTEEDERGVTSDVSLGLDWFDFSEGELDEEEELNYFFSAKEVGEKEEEVEFKLTKEEKREEIQKKSEKIRKREQSIEQVREMKQKSSDSDLYFSLEDENENSLFEPEIKQTSQVMKKEYFQGNNSYNVTTNNENEWDEENIVITPPRLNGATQTSPTPNIRKIGNFKTLNPRRK